MDGLQAVLINLGIAFVALCVVLYLSYMIGLIRVLRRLDRLTWLAFIPFVNYFAQLRAIGAPGSWFFLTFIPYFGWIYAGTMAIRYGAIFGRKATFSLFWVTMGAPIGFHMLAATPHYDEQILNSPLKTFDLKTIKRLRRPHRSKTR
jgi:hypothetical protein